MAHDTKIDAPINKNIRKYPIFLLVLNNTIKGAVNKVNNKSAYNNVNHGKHTLQSSYKFLNTNHICQI